MNRHRGFALSLLALLAGGCLLPSFPNFSDEQFAPPTVLATYTTGSARLQIQRSSPEGGSGEIVILDRVGPGSQLTSMPGAGITWRNDQGWVLQLNAFDFNFGAPPPSGAGPEAYSGDVNLQRIEGHEYWRAEAYSSSGNRCIVDLTEVSSASIIGTATCRGLRWTDGTAALGIPGPVYIEGQEPFDAEITFEATP